MGCGTTIRGRGIVSVGENFVLTFEYEEWIDHYKGFQEGVLLGDYEPGEGTHSISTLYMRDPGSNYLEEVGFEETEGPDGTRTVEWYRADESAYMYEGKPLTFTYNPYENLRRFTLHIVPLTSEVNAAIDGRKYRGGLLYDRDCPIRSQAIRPITWEWIEDEAAKLEQDYTVLVTPAEAEPGIPVVASKDIWVRQEHCQ